MALRPNKLYLYRRDVPTVVAVPGLGLSWAVPGRILTCSGLPVRRSYGEIPPRVEYEPTPRLYELDPAVRELIA